MARRIRVALWHNMIAPYRVPLFKELAKDPAIDLEVLFGQVSTKDRFWKVVADEGYRYRVLPGFNLPKFDYVMNPTLPNVLRTGRYDVILSSDAAEYGTQIAFRVARADGIPFCLWAEEVDYEKTGTFTTARDVYMAIPRAIKRVALSRFKEFADLIKRTSDSYVAFSQMAREHLLRKGAAPERIVSIRSPLDPLSFRARLQRVTTEGKVEKLREQLGLCGKKTILSLSYLRHGKGIHVLLKAFANLRRDDTVLLIVGDGPFRKHLVQMVANERIRNVSFCPFTMEPEVYYLASDLLALVSVTHEAWGLTVNEALLAGIPVVLSENVGAKEIIPDRSLIVPPGDAEVLRQALATVLDDTEIRESYRVKGPLIASELCSIEQASRGFSQAILMAKSNASIPAGTRSVPSPRRIFL